MKLSAIIITRNAEKRLARALTSVAFADEIIVVVDSATSDATHRIANDAGARVFTREWEGYGSQKNFGLEQATGDWVLFVDDDEEVKEVLKDEILNQVQDDKVSTNIYWIRIVTVFLGKPLNHLYGHNPRLFKRGSARWTTARVHEQLETPDGILVTLGNSAFGRLTSPLLHYSHPTIRSYLKKMHRYTTLDAQEMAKTHRHRSGKPVKDSFFLPYRLAGKQLLKMLLYRKGILDGGAGIVWCVLSSYYEWEMAKKYRKITNSQYPISNEMHK